MRYLCLYKPGKPEGDMPTEEEIAKMGAFIEETVKAGILLSTEGCQPSDKGFRVRLEDGDYTVTDGPFTETKELIAGFALMQFDTKEDAVYWTKRFLEVAGGGESEVRPIYDAADFGPEFTPELREQEERWRAEMETKSTR
jgi:hypothetical protein